MAAVNFPTGYNYALVNWETGSFDWILASSAATVTPTSAVYVADVLTGGAEYAASGYTRQAVTTPTVTVTLSPPSIRRSCDPPDFGAPTGGDVAAWLILAAVITDDTDSPVVAAFPVAHTADGGPALFTLPGTGALSIGFSCPSGLL